MKNNFFLILIAAISLTACKKNLSELNQNPNSPETADPQFLLSNVLYQSAKNNAEEAWKKFNVACMLS